MLIKQMIQLPLSEAEVYLYESYIGEKEAKEYLSRLEQEINWKQNSIRIFGKELLEPRLSAYYGDSGMNYFYSGTLHKPHPWHPVLLEIKRSIEGLSEVEKVLNVVFLNWYKDGRHSVAWHSDHQTELGKKPIIVSVSLGGARKFMFRSKTDHSIFNLELKNGDVLIMGKGCQEFYHHQVPKVGGKKAEMTLPRINLTYRTVLFPKNE